MEADQDCISCNTSTGASYPGEYIFLDILHPIVPVALMKATTFYFYLILVDVFSHYICIYGTSKKTSACVIDTLTRYQANHGHIGNYDYMDIARIWADSGSQFTSSKFKQHFWKAGVHLSLAAPMKLHQNLLVEQTWQSVGTMAQSLLVHARLPDSFIFHALLNSCHIFDILPVKGLYSNGQVSMPYELFQGAKPRIHHFRVFGCPITVRKWTAADKSNGKQTERGFRGIFVGFELNQKGYVFYAPGSRQLYISNDIIFDETFSSTLDVQ
jgi:transposase InsO family protein